MTKEICTVDFCGGKLEDATGYTQKFTKQHWSDILHVRHNQPMCRTCKKPENFCLVKCWVYPVTFANFPPQKSNVQSTFTWL